MENDWKNYIKASSALPGTTAYAYFDLKTPMSLKMLEDAGCRIFTCRAFANKGDPYCMILCRVARRDKKTFEAMMEKLKNRILLTGHADYGEYCVKTSEAILANMDGSGGPSDGP